MKQKWIKLPMLILSLLVLSIPAVSCSSDDYKTFSIKEGPQAFTFEYPSVYNLVRIDVSNTSESKYATIGFATAMNGDLSELYVYVWPTSSGMSTATSVLDTLLSNAESVLTGYTLELKAPATVDGQSAQEANFTATQSDPAVTSATGPAYYRVTCYIHGNWIIELDMTCTPSLKDVTQPQYDHLLQTFAALD